MLRKVFHLKPVYVFNAFLLSTTLLEHIDSTFEQNEFAIEFVHLAEIHISN